MYVHTLTYAVKATPFQLIRRRLPLQKRSYEGKILRNLRATVSSVLC